MTLSRALHMSRPIMWVPIILAYFVGIGHYSNMLKPLPIIELLLFTFPLNYFLYAINDYYDRDTDLLNPRKSGGTQGGVITPYEMSEVKKTVAIPALVALGIAIFLQQLDHFMLMSLFIFLCFAYSSKYIRLKGIPILDGFASAAIYLLPALIAYTTHSRLITLNWHYIFLILPVCGAHVISTLTDREADLQANINTTGVVFGEFKTLLYVLLTFIVPLLFWSDNLFVTTLLVYGIMITLGRIISIKTNDGASLLSAIVYSSLTGLAMIYSILLANFF